ncbi:MAG: cell division protein ZapA [bacterium]
MQKNLKISIFGKSYSINTNEDEHIIFEAVNKVNNLMKNKTKEAPTALDADKLAPIIALELAVDLTKKENILKTYENKAVHLNTLLVEKK